MIGANPLRRAIAAPAAVLMLAAQLIAAAHIHPWADASAFSRSGALVSGEIACPVCALHAHAPANTSIAPQFIRPLPEYEFVAASIDPRLLSTRRPQLLGRAPPAAV